MSARSLLALALVLFAAACGVKNDLEIPGGLPPGAEPQDRETIEGRDPSRPPQPLGQ
jgi:predicted small lipoprotein YifL